MPSVSPQAASRGHLSAVFLDYATVSHRGDLDPSSLRRVLPGVSLRDHTAQESVTETAADAQVVLLNKLSIPRRAIEALPHLRLVCLAATGTNNVDLEAAREHGIAVCNLRDYCTVSVVQHALAMMLALNQNLADYGRLIASGVWQRGDQFCRLEYPIRELTGRKLGIVGHGTLGRAFARAANLALGMQVMIANRPGSEPAPGRFELDDLLPQVDVLSLHCPLTPQTSGMLGAAQFARMKEDAILINTARGALIDSAALATALRERQLGGAGIDVLPQEPPVDGNPLLEPGIPNLIVTPHVAWAAREARQRCVDEMAANVEDFLRGGHRGRVV